MPEIQQREETESERNRRIWAGKLKPVGELPNIDLKPGQVDMREAFQRTLAAWRVKLAKTNLLTGRHDPEDAKA